MQLPLRRPAFRALATPAREPAAAEEQDAELVARAARDPEAFAALYRRHHPAIARYVRRRVGDEGAAADLVAETFVTALEALPRYRERGLPFRAWLYRLATSRIHRWLRRHPRALELPLADELGDEFPDAHEAPREAIEIARAALLSLPPRYQAPLALFHLEGFSIDEIAEALGCRPGTVKARLSRGRERLRRRLAPYARELFS